MSHVDEGRLHAWLDGLYDEPGQAAERARIEAHLAACPDCRAALDRERATRDRAADVLRAAAPAVGAPAWDDVLARRGTPSADPPQRRPAAAAPRHRRVPLAWAASIVLAVGAGWIASEVLRSEGPAAPADPAVGSARGAADRAGEDVELPPEPGGIAEAAGRAAQTAPAAPPADRFERDARAETEAAESRGAALQAAPSAAKAENLAVVAVPGADLLRDYDRAVLDDAWRDATVEEATAVLGRPPALLEGAGVEAVQLTRDEQPAAVRIVQRLDPFTVLELVQRRDPASDEADAAPPGVEAARRARTTSDSLFVLAADPDRGAAVVALQRGDVTLLLRSPIGVDSLQAIARRIRE